MARAYFNMDRNQILKKIQDAARTLGVKRLSTPAFRQQSGISQSAVLKHYDSWSEACKAAGIDCGQTRENLIPTPRISENECISEMQRVADLLGRKTLSGNEFNQHARFTSKPVIQRFGSWQNALARAGLELCEKSQKKIQLSEAECVLELQRVANMLGTPFLARDTFKKTQPRFSAHQVSRACGGWVAALKKAGLNLSPNCGIPVAQLASVFVQVVTELNRVPTLVQLARRSKHAQATFSSNRGGYSAFKQELIKYLFSARIKMPRNTRFILDAELARLSSRASTQPDPATASRPHYQGRTLNFRAFTYAPTCEHDVVQMFGAVAAELGFEIIGNRSAFPDCEARRKVVDAARERWEKCLIEYEFSSSDYKKHKHSTVGCDLIVCWQHNWQECPIEVLVLEDAIKKLDGYR